MAKQYADAGTYEAKLEKVMQRFGADKYDYNWDRRKVGAMLEQESDTE